MKSLGSAVHSQEACVQSSQLTATQPGLPQLCRCNTTHFVFFMAQNPGSSINLCVSGKHPSGNVDTPPEAQSGEACTALSREDHGLHQYWRLWGLRVIRQETWVWPALRIKHFNKLREVKKAKVWKMKTLLSLVTSNNKIWVGLVRTPVLEPGFMSYSQNVWIPPTCTD